MKIRNVFFTAALALAPLSAQQFEVASIKPSGPLDSHCAGGMPTPGRLTMRCTTVQALIQAAYGSFANGATPLPKRLNIVGAPGWIDSDRFDLEAKAEGNARLEQMAGPMLQTLLEDRFKLKVHREMREQPVYSLTVARGGLKVQPLKEVCTPVDMMNLPGPPVPDQKLPNFCATNRLQSKGQNMVWELHAMNMSDLSAYLTLRLDRPVIDKTAVAGIFDFHLEFALDETTPGFLGGRGAPAAQAADPGPSIFTAIEDLGLKLEPAKGPVEFLVIDHVEKPSGN